MQHSLRKYSVYLAASFSRKEELSGYRERFEKMGIRVTSTWLDEPVPSHEHIGEQSFDYNRVQAEQDLIDIRDADVLILFSNGLNSATRGGGRFFEMGYAAAYGCPIIVVGEREIIFQFLPSVEVVETVEQALNRCLTMAMQQMYRWLKEQDRTRVIARELVQMRETVAAQPVRLTPETIQRQMHFLDIVERG